LKEIFTLLWFRLSILLSHLSDIFSKENLLSILILFVLGTLICLNFLKALLLIWTYMISWLYIENLLNILKCSWDLLLDLEIFKIVDILLTLILIGISWTRLL
jgi:hypothetical protein